MVNRLPSPPPILLYQHGHPSFSKRIVIWAVTDDVHCGLIA